MKKSRKTHNLDVVECIDEVNSHIRAVRTFAELLEWCQEMPSTGHVEASTVGDIGYLIMEKLQELEAPLDRLKKAALKR